MICSIHIENYALIEKLHIDFHKGLNIITGETGAGKSILLGALSLVLGKRADSSVLFNEGVKCIVEAEFDVRDYQMEGFFEDNSLDYDVLSIIRREILPSGKSRSFLNDTPVNLTVLQSFALKLIDIHSQHQNLSLNNQEFLMGIIDKFAGTEMLFYLYQKAYVGYRDQKKKYDELNASKEAIKQEIDYLQHQFDELQEANLVAGELEDLENELEKLEHAEEIKFVFHNTLQRLTNEEQGVLDNFTNSLKELERISPYYKTAAELCERLKSIRIEVKDLTAEIEDSFEKLEVDPEKITQLRERLSYLYNLLSKYKQQTIEELILFKDSVEQRLFAISSDTNSLSKIKADLDVKHTEVQKMAEELSEKRKLSVPKFSGEGQLVLRDLGMPSACFTIDIQKQELSGLGYDQARFLFSSSGSSGLQDITKIASGGELSRLMLSIKYLISGSTGLPSIIFDEIDTGVSGEIADKVGNIIRKMSAGMQVINITHLPQVASKGDHHFLVYKSHEANRARTHIKLLDSDERLHEIAKMLSGEEMSNAALENARVLLNNR